MSEPQCLSEPDARAVIRLLGDVAEVEGDHRVKKRFLVSGLAKIVQADVWGWFQTSGKGGNHTPVPFLAIDGGWTSDQQKMVFLQWHGTPEYEALINSRLGPLARTGHHFTRSRQQLVDDAVWHGSHLYQHYHARARLDEFVMSLYPVGCNAVGEQIVSSIGFFRSGDVGRFGDRERFVVHLVTSEVGWLHREGTDVPAAEHVANLPPRMYQAMLWLLVGDSKKQIAAKMNLSYHTVDDHVKQLHRRFGVKNRGELLAKFLSGQEGAAT